MLLEHILVFSWNDINVIKKLHLCPFGWHRCNFLIKKLHICHFRRTPEDALAFLLILYKRKKNSSIKNGVSFLSIWKLFYSKVIIDAFLHESIPFLLCRKERKSKCYAL